jgi:hypothetical protein
MSKAFDFDPDFWFTNRALRGCSPAARGLWVDLLAIMHAERGYLTVNGQPIDDSKLSRMVGEPVASIRKWIKELGEAGIFDVDDQGRMFSSRMVKRNQFSAQAKAHGAEGARRKKGKASQITREAIKVFEEQYLKAAVTGEAAVVAEVKPVELREPPVPKSATPAKRPAPWWKTPAGWARHGMQQALPMNQDEAFEDYQCRLAARIPDGEHMQVLTARQKKIVERLRPKDPDGNIPS